MKRVNAEDRVPLAASQLYHVLKRKLPTVCAPYPLAAKTMSVAGNTNCKSMEPISAYFDVTLENRRYILNQARPVPGRLGHVTILTHATPVPVGDKIMSVVLPQDEAFDLK